jgi:hypothetical protein
VRALELLVQKYQREGNSFQTFIESQWDQADTDGSGTLTQDEVLQVCPCPFHRLACVPCNYSSCF